MGCKFLLFFRELWRLFNPHAAYGTRNPLFSWSVGIVEFAVKAKFVIQKAIATSNLLPQAGLSQSSNV